LRGIIRTDEGKQRLASLCSVCAALRNERLLNRIDTERYRQYADFPFEGSAVYSTRHDELKKETLEKGDPTELFDRLRTALADLKRHAGQAGCGAEPGPHAAALVADGDRMGAAISSLLTPDEHRTFSQRLATFAGDAAQVVQKQYGVLVYSGGDDVLALLPVDRCLTCARELERLFQRSMRQPSRRASRTMTCRRSPSVSPLVTSWRISKTCSTTAAAEKAAEARSQRPGRPPAQAAVRGQVRKQWPDNLDTRLTQYADWFCDGAVSNRTPYELDRLAVVYEDWKGRSPPHRNSTTPFG
jgi:CRISPR-associated protein Cmr2